MTGATAGCVESWEYLPGAPCALALYLRCTTHINAEQRSLIMRPCRCGGTLSELAQPGVYPS